MYGMISHRITITYYQNDQNAFDRHLKS